MESITGIILVGTVHRHRPVSLSHVAELSDVLAGDISASSTKSFLS